MADGPVPPITAYTDAFSVQPGDTLPVRVSTTVRAYRADVVRLISAETARDGSGFLEEVVPAIPATDHEGREQGYPFGSWASVPDHPALHLTGAFTLQAWIQPTRLAAGEQTILARMDASGAGYALAVGADGALELIVGGGREVARFTSGVPLAEGRWSFVAATFDPSVRHVRVVQWPVPAWPVEPHAASAEGPVPREFAAAPARDGTPLTFAARPGADDAPATHFNGRIARPRIFTEALPDDRLRGLAAGEAPADVGPVVAAFDFSIGIPTEDLHDTGPFHLLGRTHSLPARAMTDHTWRGQELDWTRDASAYGAIHFHDDDLADAGWEADFEVTLPADLPTGIYAVRLATVDGSSFDRLPFVVRPPSGTATAPLLFLQSTNTHLAYANWHPLISEERARVKGYPWPYPLTPEKAFGERVGLLSMYDRHSDGSGVCFVSIRQPIMNMRPDMNDELSLDGGGWAHGVKADLHVAGWPTSRGLGYDVACDEDLDREGLDLLRRYRVVMTGTHPEYWTAAMLDAAEAYLAQGGRFIYLGGNGMYWVTSYVAGRPGAIEVRRSGGTQAWTANVGEEIHQTTGEQGGVWRQRGRAPQRAFGIGFTSQGGGRAQPYRRTPASHDPRVAWMFEGIGDDEPIGVDGLVMRGAAGFEIDRADPSLGTPPHALIVAVATGFDDQYQHVTEEVPSSNSRQGGTVEPRVRAELVFFETPNDGAVFSVGSICYGSALPINNGDNPVSRLTENVIRGFLRDGPIISPVSDGVGVAPK
jgi:N,N-dimethylformamidase